MMEKTSNAVFTVHMMAVNAIRAVQATTYASHGLSMVHS